MKFGGHDELRRIEKRLISQTKKRSSLYIGIRNHMVCSVCHPRDIPTYSDEKSVDLLFYGTTPADGVFHL